MDTSRNRYYVGVEPRMDSTMGTLAPLLVIFWRDRKLGVIAGRH